MTLSPEVQAIITAALEAGRLRRIAEGVRGLSPKLSPEPVLPLIAAEQCLGGRQVARLPGLDAYDRITLKVHA